ncbi:MAG: phosphate signaling complex protein PhoU [Asgard group archaeon]|nr:phosphate signaling complex protein PhoU [Asgard group archaeon]
MSEKKQQFGGTIRFQEIMDDLSSRLAKLSDLVIKMIQQGQKALISDDEELFKQIKVDLETVHKLCYSLEDTVLSSIALFQPFARDLRYILSTLKISNEIHRSAHDAVHIAHSSSFINLEIHANVIARIGELAKKASDMFKDSILAFRNRKAPSVKDWQKLDDDVDTLHEQIIDDVVKLMQDDPSWARAGVSLILSTRYIERIADHACNIVEESIYVVTSKREKIE